MLSAPFAVLMLSSVLATSVISGVFGMAGGMILMGIYAASLPVTAAMILHGITQLAANGFRLISLFNHVDWRSSRWFVAGTALSAAIFWSVAFVPSRPILFLFLGGLPFVALLRRMPHLDFERPKQSFACGFFVTAAQLTAGVSGPLMDLFFVRSQKGRFETIATKAFCQVLGHALKLVYFATLATSTALESNEVFSSDFLVGVIVLALVGTLVGGVILKRMSDTDFRRYTRAIVLGLGAVYLTRGLLLCLE